MTCQNKGLFISLVFHLGIVLLLAGVLPADSGTGRSVHMDFSIVQSAMAGSVPQQKSAKIKHSVKKTPRKTQTVSGPPILEARDTASLEPDEPVLDEPKQEDIEQEAAPEGTSGNAIAGATEHGTKGRDFSYIKQLLQKNLKYPNIARRKGWEGKVIITFVIACDGSVREIEIIESSGKALLDSDAVKVVNKTVPFPKHEMETRVLIPIVYSLTEERV